MAHYPGCFVWEVIQKNVHHWHVSDITCWLSQLLVGDIFWERYRITDFLIRSFVSSLHIESARLGAVSFEKLFTRKYFIYKIKVFLHYFKKSHFSASVILLYHTAFDDQNNVQLYNNIWFLEILTYHLFDKGKIF